MIDQRTVATMAILIRKTSSIPFAEAVSIARNLVQAVEEAMA